MLPAMTCSQPNSLRPSRWQFESRRLREEPPAFVCAMASNPSVGSYLAQFCDEIITFFGDYPGPTAFFRGAEAQPLRANMVAALRAATCLPSLSPDYSAVAACSSAAFGLRARLGLAAALLGLAPSVRISVIRTRVNSWRWPRFLREFLRRRFLKAITLGPRPCSTTSAATEAPATVGVPIVAESPPTTSTSPNWTISPGSPLIFSTFSKSSAATRYCFPPVLMTANIVLVLVFEFPELGGSGFFQSVKGLDGA